MRVNVKVHGLQFMVPCGEGSQPCRWLGLVVAQRYALAAPHGRCRTREDAHIQQGFFLPAAITRVNGQLLRPDKRLAESCKDNETLTVTLQQQVPVNEIGAPQFTPWTVNAFFPSLKTDKSGEHTLDATAQRKSSRYSGDAKAKAVQPQHEQQPASEEAADGADEAEAKGGDDRAASTDELKQYAHAEMLQQVNSGQFLSEMEVEAAFLYDWGRLYVEDIVQEPRERELLQELLLSRFAALNAGYSHYATGSSELSYGMSGSEFLHFLHECELTRVHVANDQKLVEKVVAQCLRKNTLVSMQDRGTLARAGFLHALLRVVQLVSPPADASAPSSFVEILDNSLKDHVLPTISRLTSGPFRDHSHHDKMVAVFQEGKPKLLKLYAKYAQEHAPPPPSRLKKKQEHADADADADPEDDSTPSPPPSAPASSAPPVSSTWPLLLSAPGLKSMLYDCGMFFSGTPEQHDALFNRAVDASFSGMREATKPEDQLLVFAEFLEVTARVALAVLEQENELPPRDAIKLALDAVRSLPFKLEAPRVRK